MLKNGQARDIRHFRLRPILAGNGSFLRKSWKYHTAYGKGGGPGSEGLSPKIRPCVEDFYLAYLLEPAPLPSAKVQNLALA